MPEYHGPERRVNRSWIERLAMPMLGLGVALMIIALVFGWSSLRSLNDRKTADTGICNVANGVIHETNRTNGLIFLLFGTIQLSASQREDPAAQRRADAYEAFARGVKYIPELDCRRSVDSPGKYRVPVPIPYSEYLQRGRKPPVDLPPIGG